MYEPRTYRDLFKGSNLVFFNCSVRETDLQIGVHAPSEVPAGHPAPDGHPAPVGHPASLGHPASAEHPASPEHPASAERLASLEHRASAGTLQTEAFMSVIRHRAAIEDYAAQHPEFLTSFVPLKPAADAPLIVKRMCSAGELAGVGPMAAVAGAISEFVGMDLLRFTPEVIVENGGDIFLKTLSIRRVGIYAGSSPLSEKIALEIPPASTPLGICTSSGTVGHSVSFGRADAAVILARDTALADAAATAVGNMVQSDADLRKAVRFASKIPSVSGAVVILGDKMAVWGDVKLVGL